MVRFPVRTSPIFAALKSCRSIADKTLWGTRPLFLRRTTGTSMDSKIVEFDEVIAFHTAWKRKLKNYLTKPDGSLKPADVANADGCALAEWIRVNEHHYSSMPEFATLKG